MEAAVVVTPDSTLTIRVIGLSRHRVIGTVLLIGIIDNSGMGMVPVIFMRRGTPGRFRSMTASVTIFIGLIMPADMGFTSSSSTPIFHSAFEPVGTDVKPALIDDPLQT